VTTLFVGAIAGAAIERASIIKLHIKPRLSPEIFIFKTLFITYSAL